MAFPLISKALPLTTCLRYHHLGLAVSNPVSCVEFLSKIGFKEVGNEPNSINVMKNKGGLEFHVFLCDKPLDDDRNLLMDYPQNKYPGHTHASFIVPSVPNARKYLESQGLFISGERKMGDTLHAVFSRDPDRTTFEFENNSGAHEDIEVTGEHIGYPAGIDHIGIRVSDPVSRWQWYAEKLGFNREVMKYEHNPDLIKNFIPWIARTESNIDINFIINANELVSENILLAAGVVRPGIIYACYTVNDIAQTAQRLTEGGVKITWDEDIEQNDTLKCLSNKMVRYGNHKSLWLQDEDHNVIRLLEEIV